ncbi:uncharacterized protein N7484_008028 [Penicillium longicatenatum]|uniref:uncharacterized protein n=1 Tax=Penicillium longicatenatum TaxID=1561947 RepID=UPI002548C78C|nr:uncharacterized protein N7484_008028 [Penicillium longicatenatum]KAJ5640166.1 hypothetical protein N7484_008028 [Penicillium longicatenatum]
MIFMQPEQDMSRSSVIYESDTGSEDRLGQSNKFKIQASFEIARPPPKFFLRLGPKLLLQIQQVAQNHRPVPVLEIWQPPFCKSNLTREFHHAVKLRSGDVYVTLGESYITSSTQQKDVSNLEQPSDNATAHGDIIAAICHDEEESHIHFRNARCSWRASTQMTGHDQSIISYRFTMSSRDGDLPDQGRMVLQWEKRRKEHVPAGSVDADQFVFLLIDRQVKKKSRIATMTTDGFKVVVRKSSILDGLKACFDLMEPIGPEDRHSSRNLETWLYTLTLTLGVLVRHKEGWLN